jgi:thiol-disulfide isomerase/thioredoxin
MQLKSLLPFILMFISLGTIAQTDAGMDFIKAESWAEVKAKAKAENKYIFLDGYTTWCGPCIMMAKKIFPLPEVGEFYNANFINVKVQLDTTEKDNDHVKKWYQDGHDLMVKYKINVFPTYIFFSPDGEIVHRAVGSSDATTFINKGKDALNPDKQYYALARQYDKGRRDPEFLKKLSYASRNAYDNENMKKYSREYLASQRDLLTPENITYLTEFTQSTRDTGFALMLKYPEKFDAVKKPGFAVNETRSMILNEDVFPIIFPKNGDPTDNPSAPDWSAIEKMLKKKYSSDLAVQATLQGKIFYYQQKDNWTLFSKSVTEMLTKYPTSLHPEMMNSYAWKIFESCDDMECVKQALGWSKISNDKQQDDPMLLDTYANLLHRTGDTKNAITIQKKAIEILKKNGEETDDYEETLAKMEKGEKTWN